MQARVKLGWFERIVAVVAVALVAAGLGEIARGLFAVAKAVALGEYAP